LYDRAWIVAEGITCSVVIYFLSLFMPEHAARFGDLRRIGQVKLDDNFPAKILRHADNDFMYLRSGVVLMWKDMAEQQIIENRRSSIDKIRFAAEKD
jgi:hypothetical protein